ncbi:hypothetical protein ACPCIT_09495 [Pseudomonas siliginis]|uniref:hypothetical protein n=1 Tax=Pseudomonas siliginis TaxID=2842346 RepID=UPI003C2ED97A
MADTEKFMDMGNVHEMDYWCEPRELFAFLDIISPAKGSRFPCPVCSNTKWGCSTVEAPDQEGIVRTVVAPCQMPLKLHQNKTVSMQGKELPNYHYALVCLSCTNTLFFNAAMVQAKIKLIQGSRDGE